MVQSPYPMKRCSKCQIEKPLEAFFKKASTKSGYQSACKICKKNYEREYYVNGGNAEKCAKRREETREYQRLTQKEWRSKNQGVKNFHTAKYRALKKQATPRWLTSDQLKHIKEIYRQARQLTEETGTEHQVDHIHPLNGRTSSGLHVPWNLQILTKEENEKKSNKLC
jgi:5-methylcytosine-specific restriction endonuclease McrA